MLPLEHFQATVWSRIRALVISPDFPDEVSDQERDRFITVLRYIFDLRYGQNAARVTAAYFGYALATSADFSDALIELAASLEIGNTSITYIEDKIIDNDEQNQWGHEWAHVHFGLELTTVVNSFVHCLTRKTFYSALQLRKSDGDFQSVEHWMMQEFENIFRDANYGQFLDVIYGEADLDILQDQTFRRESDPCPPTLSDHINALRTGQFVRRSAEFGCVFGGILPASHEWHQLHLAMHLVGLCVQDLNDLQDFVPTKEFPGTYGRDLLLSKKTFPIIRLLERSQSRKDIRDLLKAKKDRSVDKKQLLLEARNILIQEGVFDEMLQRMRRRIDRAATLLLNAFPIHESVIESYFAVIRLKIQQLEPTNIRDV